MALLNKAPTKIKCCIDSILKWYTLIFICLFVKWKIFSPSPWPLFSSFKLSCSVGESLHLFTHCISQVLLMKILSPFCNSFIYSSVILQGRKHVHYWLKVFVIQECGQMLLTAVTSSLWTFLESIFCFSNSFYKGGAIRISKRMIIKLFVDFCQGPLC